LDTRWLKTHFYISYIRAFLYSLKEYRKNYYYIYTIQKAYVKHLEENIIKILITYIEKVYFVQYYLRIKIMFV